VPYCSCCRSPALRVQPHRWDHPDPQIDGGDQTRRREVLANAVTRESPLSVCIRNDRVMVRAAECDLMVQESNPKANLDHVPEPPPHVGRRQDMLVALGQPTRITNRYRRAPIREDPGSPPILGEEAMQTRVVAHAMANMRAKAAQT